MLWLAIHFPQLQLDSVCCVDKEAQHACVIEASQQVVQLDDLAQGEGVQKGMRIASACALIEDLRILEFDPAFENKRLHELAAICYDFSSDIVVRADTNTLLLEVSGMLRLFRDSLHFYVAALNEVLVAQRVCVESAMAASPLAAELLACYASSSLNALPDVFDIEASERRLSALSIESLDIAPALKTKLLRLGLKTLAELQALPRSELAMRAGKELVEYLASLSTDARQVLPRFKPPEHFKQSVSFDEEVFTAPALLFPLRRLLSAMEHYLKQRARCANGLRLHLIHRTGARQTLNVESAAPEYREEHWHGLLRLKLEQFRLEQPVLAVELEIQTLLEIEGESADLFERCIAPHKLSNVLSRIEAKLGSQSVQQANLLPDHAPEQSYDYRNIDLKKRAKSWQVQEPLRQYADSVLRPSMLFEEPRALSEAVRIVHGPERIQTGWWREQEICRDYFVAVNLEKQLLWVFRDRNQRWFVHGLFA